ncbi:hypothetical protein [Thalassomonas actiniarum]|uniref:Uncharacterized protein n=1 Tax=Thalassomonas actiniarum TaxID=485447 RepID=A0AAF0C1K1_9GAMM|nr:hypothetical protein [Thalassomonas actiniarum]WDD99081.1 hypothetical protein SG35_028340 [Thalassomonas actiniarum]
MNNIKKKFIGLAAVLFVPFHLMANEVNAFIEETPIDECHIINDQLQPVPELGETNASLTPIYIGGTLYQLDKADFTPVMRDSYFQDPCTGKTYLIKVVVAYTATIPVSGDVGQELIFNINGDTAGKVMKLTASCGAFSASDLDDKFSISKRMRTNQTCTSMKLTLDVTGSKPASIDLNVLIAEPF